LRLLFESIFLKPEGMVYRPLGFPLKEAQRVSLETAMPPVFGKERQLDKKYSYCNYSAIAIFIVIGHLLRCPFFVLKKQVIR
jgi:hypothetical protein